MNCLYNIQHEVTEVKSPVRMPEDIQATLMLHFIFIQFHFHSMACRLSLSIIINCAMCARTINQSIRRFTLNGHTRINGA